MFINITQYYIFSITQYCIANIYVRYCTILPICFNITYLKLPAAVSAVLLGLARVGSRRPAAVDLGGGPRRLVTMVSTPQPSIWDESAEVRATSPSRRPGPGHNGRWPGARHPPGTLAPPTTRSGLGRTTAELRAPRLTGNPLSGSGRCSFNRPRSCREPVWLYRDGDRMTP